MFYGLEKHSGIPVPDTSEIGISDSLKWICNMIIYTTEQKRGHHCIESEWPSPYQVLNLRICRKRRSDLPEADIATCAFVLVLTQFMKQGPASATVGDEDSEKRTVPIT